MDPLKEAFQKVRKDIEFLYSEIGSLKGDLLELRTNIQSLVGITSKITENLSKKQDLTPNNIPTQKEIKTTTPTHSSTHISTLETLKGQNIGISIGNGGVPTDRQTDRQTDQQTKNSPKIHEKIEENSIDNAARMLDSLDSIKREIRLKFKRLTDQEILVFSTIYQIDEETGPTDYKVVSIRLKLSESSIRDYVGRLIKKGIPVEKKRINNKTIQLSISPNLKKIASLPTILQLRDL